MDTVVRSRATAVMIGGLVVLLVAVGIMLALREPTEAPPGTPEATAQGYFRAIVDDDRLRAETYLADSLIDRCDGTYRPYEHSGDGLRVVIVDTVVRQDRATVSVSITERYDEGPFFTDSHTFDEVLMMERADDRWLISQTPWPLYCWEE